MTLPAAVSTSRNEVRTVAPRLIELTETLVYPAITHLAFYPGWPSAMSAAKVVKQVFDQEKRA